MGEHLKSGWTVPRSEDFDLKDFALGVLEIAKENLQRDGELVSTAFLVTDKQLQCLSIAFADHEEKPAAYRELVKAAQEAGASALITCNDAYWSTKAGSEDVEGYYPGKLAAEGARECIMLTVSGPGIQTWCVDVPYVRSGKKIEFSKATESFGQAVGFLQGWAQEGVRVQ